MMSQILFGERYTISDQAGSWIKIETLFDSYTGWIDTSHLQSTTDESDSVSYVLNKMLPCYKEDRTKLVLEPGCEIYEPDFINKKFKAGKSIYSTGTDFNPSYISAKESITDTAMKFINSPYIWGGRIPSGIDCSGLTQLVYKIHGIAIPRDSGAQVKAGVNVDFVDEAEPGDLVFFDNERGTITHVGMIISKGLIIHASGRVRIDIVDHQGIFKHETGIYSHHLRTIKRISSKSGKSDLFE